MQHVDRPTTAYQQCQQPLWCVLSPFLIWNGVDDARAGGQLLLWLEQVSFMAARKLSPTAWSTAACVDGRASRKASH